MATNHFLISRPIRRKRGMAASMLLLGSLLAACVDTGNVNTLRRMIDRPTTTPHPTQRLEPSLTPTPTETPDFNNAQSVIQAPQVIEVPVTVLVVATPTPDIQGFSDAPAVDERIQPCPVRYWKSPDPRSEGIGTMTEDRGRGRCHATEAQIEQYAQEVQP
jgi:hypothetical protein